MITAKQALAKAHNYQTDKCRDMVEKQFKECEKAIYEASGEGLVCTTIHQPVLFAVERELNRLGYEVSYGKGIFTIYWGN